MFGCGQDFTDAMVSRIESVIAADPNLSRRALSRQV